MKESALQTQCVHWFRLQHPKLAILSIPNGAFLGGRNPAAIFRKLQREGFLVGASDLFLAEPRGKYHGFWIELKVGNNKPTKAQREFLKDMEERGYYTAVIREFDHFKAEVNDYLKGGSYEC